MAETPKTFGYDELLQRATTHNITTLCCISNYLNGDLISTAEWTGIPLPDLLKEAGVNPKAVDLKLTAADGYEESIPLAVGLDPHTMLVLKMNGQPLPPDHGAPARLIVPPIYGMKNVKWIQKIEAIDNDFMGYWEERGWSDTAHYQIWGRFDTPRDGDTTPAGPAVLAGLASAGNRGIKRVEISLDGGKTWADATLEPSLNPPFTWVRWLYQFDARPGTYNAVLRATDGTGAVMIEQDQPPLPDGATGWPRRTINVG
jgi:DMSO/TMAO reductase YedYZ molybdopterin-dependent catalytic subunit